MTLSQRLFIAVAIFAASALSANDRPNIIWIVVEDASAHIEPYGETAIKTPTLNQMAKDGIRFDQAFVTAPVCSPSRSAMVTGMYQMTLGAHNHRSQGRSGKSKGPEAYHASYKVPVPLIPELFRKAGYYVTNKTKTDYNFIPPDTLYHGKEWSKASPDQPIFAQIQLRGGKNRRAPSHADPASLTLPPYYPDHDEIRKDWATYLDSWVQVDVEVKRIFAALEKANRLKNSAIFFWTDHGISHLRGKQYLYEEGLRIPFIVQLPKKAKAGTVRTDIVEHIDIAAASLALANIPIPEHVQGRDILSPSHTPRTHVFAGRDRCDETVDIMRCIRDSQYKYIRNFMSHVSHSQPNQYKDGKRILKTIRTLNAEGKLSEIQARPFEPRRPPEELYDLKSDPHELNNLAADPTHKARLEVMRTQLYQRMREERDMGLIPEPILEDLGRDAGNKRAAFTDTNRAEQTSRLIDVITAGEHNETQTLLAATTHSDPSTRYWAAVWLGVNKTAAAKPQLESLLSDEDAAVRIASAQALVKLGDPTKTSILVDHINDPNWVAGMFALRAIEELGEAGKPFKTQIMAARKSPYEFSRRIAKRLSAKF